MVRNMVGCLVAAACGRVSADDVEGMLEARQGLKADFPCGWAGNKAATVLQAVNLSTTMGNTGQKGPSTLVEGQFLLLQQLQLCEIM